MKRVRTISRQEEFSSPPRATTLEYDTARTYREGDLLLISRELVPGGIITNDLGRSGVRFGIVTRVPNEHDITLEFELTVLS